MAVPKRKTSKSRRDKRRTHQKIAVPSLTACPQCGETKLPHRACPNCGTYKGRTVIETEE
ncbi:MAG: 50S ribosomal protein L32 [Pseudomonadota bacterium]|jgi:large subunit ribosomal protein L32